MRKSSTVAAALLVSSMFTAAVNAEDHDDRKGWVSKNPWPQNYSVVLSDFSEACNTMNCTVYRSTGITQHQALEIKQDFLENGTIPEVEINRTQELTGQVIECNNTQDKSIRAVSSTQMFAGRELFFNGEPVEKPNDGLSYQGSALEFCKNGPST